MSNPIRAANLLLILSVVLLVAGIAILTTALQSEVAQFDADAAEYTALREQAQQDTDADSPADKTAISSTESPALQTTDAVTESAVSKNTAGGTGVDLAACQAQNADFAAWLQIPGTSVDYPVVCSDDTDYYLNHTFSGKKSYVGTLFALAKTDFQAPSKNIAIYGHHIRSNPEIMFSPLIAYKQQDFYQAHKTILLDTLHHSGTYTIFAVINMRNGDWDASATKFADDQEFFRFVERSRSKALYGTGVEVNATDEIITLITCDRSYIPIEGRLVVMAVKQ